MIARLRRVSIAVVAMLTIASACPADSGGYRAGRGGIGGQIGGASVVAENEYSTGAAARFSFSGHWRYAITPWLRWQISPGFTWSSYPNQDRAPFR